MTAPIRKLIDEHGYPVIGEEDVDGFVSEYGRVVLFFTGDPQRIGETADIAVILPELMKVFGDVFRPAVVARTAERPLQLRYRFNTYPALVFLAPGGYLGALTRVRDWNDYLVEIADIITREPGEPPPFRLPGCMTAEADSRPDNGSGSYS